MNSSLEASYRLCSGNLKKFLRLQDNDGDVHQSFLDVKDCFVGCPCRQLFQDWTVELKGMADRIITMRHKLFDALKQKGEPWGHIRGLF